MTLDEKEIKPVSIAEVKNLLSKLSKEREELLYEQKIALEHAQKFGRLSIKDTNELIKELEENDFIEESHAYRIADLLPQTEEEVQAIFAKEKVSLKEGDVKKILDIVKKYYSE
ncbi:MAG: RNA polymerase Rpb4 family protein [Candidatus Thermoplasmatota archaeon]